MGTTVSAITSEATITMQTVVPTSVRKRANRPPLAPMKINGMNTQIVVAVEAMMGMATALVPWSAAVFASSPRSWWCRKIDSMTTMELSTSMPNANIRPIKLMMLRVISETATARYGPASAPAPELAYCNINLSPAAFWRYDDTEAALGAVRESGASIRIRPCRETVGGERSRPSRSDL